ncbi:Maf family protein [Methylomarinum roseum]
MTKQIVLASASPRRRELLDQIGVSYRVHVVDIDETPLLNELPRAYVTRIAAEKSAACCSQLNVGKPVLAADTAVVVQGRIMGKPQDFEHARQMLELLSGQTHQVYSAVSVRGDNRHEQAVSITDVTFRALTGNEIKAYWRTGEPRDKAGAYAIQGFASIFIQSIKGSFSGVVGLPLFETAQLLERQGIKIIT